MTNQAIECSHNWVTESEDPNNRYFELNALDQSVMVTPITEKCTKCTATHSNLRRTVASRGKNG